MYSFFVTNVSEIRFYAILGSLKSLFRSLGGRIVQNFVRTFWQGGFLNQKVYIKATTMNKWEWRYDGQTNSLRRFGNRL